MVWLICVSILFFIRARVFPHAPRLPESRGYLFFNDGSKRVAVRGEDSCLPTAKEQGLLFRKNHLKEVNPTERILFAQPKVVGVFIRKGMPKGYGQGGDGVVL